MATKIPTIGPKFRIYGYVTGLGVQPMSADHDTIPRRLYATFETFDGAEVWIVPDEDLFEQLLGPLSLTAWMRKNSNECCLSSVFIEKEGKEWLVGHVPDDEEDETPAPADLNTLLLRLEAAACARALAEASGRDFLEAQKELDAARVEVQKALAATSPK